MLSEHSLLEMGAQHDLLVLAPYGDGRVRDVTRFAIFTATDDAVATVDKHGRATVVAWFASQVKLARITSPDANDLSPDLFAKSPRTNCIDELVLAQRA